MNCLEAAAVIAVIQNVFKMNCICVYFCVYFFYVSLCLAASLHVKPDEDDFSSNLEGMYLGKS